MTRSVLVVEDEVIVANDMTEMLREAGFDALKPAHNDDQARRRLREQDVDLVFLDVNLKGGNEGIQLAREWSNGLDVVFVSAYMDEQTLREAEKTGAIGYLAKPATEDQVLDILRHLSEESVPPAQSFRRGELFDDESTRR